MRGAGLMGRNLMTANLVLRDVREADLAIFFEHQRDPVASRMAAFTAKDPSDGDAFMAHWVKIRNDPNIRIRTILVDGRVVGNIAKWVNEFGNPEVTYWIAREEWGKGIATLALSRLLSEVTQRPIYGRAARDNTGSLRVLEKCGFTITGYDKGFANARGEEIEEAMLILR